MKNRILVVDDERNMRWAIKNALVKEGFDVFEASNGKEGLEMLASIEPNLVLLDIRMPGMDGIETLTEIKKKDKDVPVIMITAHGTMEMAIDALKLGALDFVSKPFELEKLKIIIRNALDLRNMKEEISYLKEELRYNTGQRIIGSSKKMQDVLDMVNRVAKTNATVLILGESGTGKEVIANAVHYNSDRKDNPYIKVNCGAIPENLIESELFGYEKGAFTGAGSRKIGKFERANKGTIFLDEIGELSLPLQVKLLRVLQQKEFERVGGTENIKIDIRIITATNKNLLEMVEKGLFREDLYYRLNVIPIELPPLRERVEDIPQLIDYFTEKYSLELSKKDVKIDSSVIQILCDYTWKGNIRELENVIERMVILCDGNRITENIIPAEVKIPSTSENSIVLPAKGLKLEEVEKELIVQALTRTDNNQTKAARLLGITRHTLLYRMEKYSIK
ncbi:sigma-54-dependent Fis family transcriptional regulator [Alkalicella caledoniensis]|uniref:Stage 0 sporulation protein A homolog n=1 Tax=Alkalicella caledoniensis TaxID=2731377 RepID=A0A7G9WBK0_ALKCA|nr:sigma-54 dependent transcriptional regulator [Alkalicella caledoniensis]QNO16062.1 sigma-54-dependent Fis family transcriptional regulator [Alkalicella caledoniensis]